MSGRESVQKKLLKFKPARVSIYFESQTGEDKIKFETLPFVLGIIAPLSGQKSQKYKGLMNKDFINVTKQTLDGAVANIEPTLKFNVKNVLDTDSSVLTVDLKFKKFDDFNPGKIAQNVPKLAALMENRKDLIEIRNLIESNDRLEQALINLARNPNALAKFLKSSKDKKES